MSNVNTASDIFDEMADKWPSEVIERGRTEEFTGGMITGRTMANLDSKGEGPEVRIKYGKKKVAYPVIPFVRWMRNRSTIIYSNAAEQKNAA